MQCNWKADFQELLDLGSAVIKNSPFLWIPFLCVGYLVRLPNSGMKVLELTFHWLPLTPSPFLNQSGGERKTTWLLFLLARPSHVSILQGVEPLPSDARGLRMWASDSPMGIQCSITIRNEGNGYEIDTKVHYKKHVSYSQLSSLAVSVFAVLPTC